MVGVDSSFQPSFFSRAGSVNPQGFGWFLERIRRPGKNWRCPRVGLLGFPCPLRLEVQFARFGYKGANEWAGTSASKVKLTRKCAFTWLGQLDTFVVFVIGLILYVALYACIQRCVPSYIYIYIYICICYIYIHICIVSSLFVYPWFDVVFNCFCYASLYTILGVRRAQRDVSCFETCPKSRGRVPRCMFLCRG